MLSPLLSRRLKALYCRSSSNVCGRKKEFISRSSFVTLLHIAASLPRFDPCLDHSLNLIRLFFDLLHAGYHTASRVTEKFVGPRKHDKPHLLTEIIQRRRAHSGSGQPLLHSGKAAFARAQGKKLYLLVWIEAKMLEYQPCR